MMRLQTSRRGAVLLLVMGAVALLAILAVEVSHRAKMDVSRTSRESQNLAFERCFFSGRELAKGLLTEGREKGWDSKAGAWSKSFAVELNAGERIRVSIADEAGKLNILQLINSAGTRLPRPDSLDRLFDYLKTEDSRRREYWERMGLKVRERLDGARQYEMFTLDGLREAGLTRAEVFGGYPAQELTSGIEKSQSAFPLCELLTVVGEGKFNLNTASKAVLFSMEPRITQAQVEQIALYRGDASEGDIVPFQRKEELGNVPGFTAQTSNDAAASLWRSVQEKVDVKSKYFSVRMLAEVQGKTREAWCYLEVPPPPYIKPLPDIQVLMCEEIEP